VDALPAGLSDWAVRRLRFRVAPEGARDGMPEGARDGMPADPPRDTAGG